MRSEFTSSFSVSSPSSSMYSSGSSVYSSGSSVYSSGSSVYSSGSSVYSSGSSSVLSSVGASGVSFGISLRSRRPQAKLFERDARTQSEEDSNVLSQG